MSPRRPPEPLRPWCGALALVRARHRRAVADRDRGTSLMELVVGMAIMTIFMSIFTGAIVMLYRTANASEAVNNSTSQLNQAFLTLDRTVRYAAAISTPGVATGGSGSWYVELRTTNTGSEICTQLRTDAASNQLQRRTWPVTAAGAGTPTAWTPLASGITNATATVASGDQPFTLPARSDTVNYQRLAFTLLTQAGPANQRTTSRSAYTFTAVNSTATPGGGICTFTGWRP